MLALDAMLTLLCKHASNQAANHPANHLIEQIFERRHLFAFAFTFLCLCVGCVQAALLSPLASLSSLSLALAVSVVWLSLALLESDGDRARWRACGRGDEVSVWYIAFAVSQVVCLFGRDCGEGAVRRQPSDAYLL